MKMSYYTREKAPAPQAQHPTQPSDSVKSPMPTKSEDTLPSPAYRVIDFGEIPSSQFSQILDELTKSWGRSVEKFIDAKSPPTFKDQFKSDLTNAAYRVGATQLINATKAFFVQYVRRSCSEESKIRAITELLNTEIGTALTTMFIGVAVSQIPQVADSPKMNRLLKEFRVSGMATIGNSAVEAVLSSILPVIGSALQEIEKAETVHVSEKSVQDNLSILEEEMIVNSENEVARPLQRQS